MLPYDIQAYIRDKIIDPIDHINYCDALNLNYNLQVCNDVFCHGTNGYKKSNIFIYKDRKYTYNKGYNNTCYICGDIFDDEEKITSIDKILELMRDKNIFFTNILDFEYLSPLLNIAKSIHIEIYSYSQKQLYDQNIVKILNKINIVAYVYSSLYIYHNNHTYVKLVIRINDNNCNDILVKNHKYFYLYSYDYKKHINKLIKTISLTILFPSRYICNKDIIIENLPNLKTLNIFSREFNNTISIRCNNVPSLLIVFTNIKVLNVNGDKMPIIKYLTYAQ